MRLSISAPCWLVVYKHSAHVPGCLSGCCIDCTVYTSNLCVPVPWRRLIKAFLFLAAAARAFCAAIGLRSHKSAVPWLTSSRARRTRVWRLRFHCATMMRIRWTKSRSSILLFRRSTVLFILFHAFHFWNFATQCHAFHFISHCLFCGQRAGSGLLWASDDGDGWNIIITAKIYEKTVLLIRQRQRGPWPFCWMWCCVCATSEASPGVVDHSTMFDFINIVGKLPNNFIHTRTITNRDDNHQDTSQRNELFVLITKNWAGKEFSVKLVHFIGSS